MRVMTKDYNELDDAAKKKYIDMAEEHKKKHAEEVKAFEDSGRKAEYEAAVKELQGSRKEEMSAAKKKGTKKTGKKKTGKTTTKKGGKKKDDSDSEDEDEDDEDEDEDDDSESE